MPNFKLIVSDNLSKKDVLISEKFYKSFDQNKILLARIEKYINNTKAQNLFKSSLKYNLTYFSNRKYKSDWNDRFRVNLLHENGGRLP